MVHTRSDHYSCIMPHTMAVVWDNRLCTMMIWLFSYFALCNSHDTCHKVFITALLFINAFVIRYHIYNIYLHIYTHMYIAFIQEWNQDLGIGIPLRNKKYSLNSMMNDRERNLRIIPTLLDTTEQKGTLLTRQSLWELLLIGNLSIALILILIKIIGDMLFMKTCW